MRVIILEVFATVELTVVGSTRPVTINTVDIINDEGVICEWSVGMCLLCQHNFEHIRCEKESGNIPE